MLSGGVKSYADAPKMFVTEANYYHCHRRRRLLGFHCTWNRLKNKLLVLVTHVFQLEDVVIRVSFSFLSPARAQTHRLFLVQGRYQSNCVKLCQIVHCFAFNCYLSPVESTRSHSNPTS